MPEGAPRVRLGDVDGALALLFAALCGRRRTVLAEEELAAGLEPADTADTIRLPLSVAAFATRRENRDWYAVAVAHRAGHERLATFALDLPAILAGLGVDSAPSVEARDEGGAWTGYYALFGRSALALATFAVVEDLRVDNHLPHYAPGLAAALQSVMRHELALRDPLAPMSPREQGLECLVRLSLEGTGKIRVAEEVASALPEIAALLARVRRDPSMSSSDTAIVAAGLYLLIDQLPSTSRREQLTALPFLEEVSPASADDLRALVAGRFPEAHVSGFEGEHRLAATVRRVGYRDLPGLRYRGVSAGSTPLHQQILLFGPSASLTGETRAGCLPGKVGDDAVASGASRPGPPEPLPHEHHHLPDLYHRHHRDEARGGETVRYPEWDGLDHKYLPAWATVQEEIAPRTATGAPSAALARRDDRRALVAALRSFSSEGRKMVGRVRDGEEIDFDGSVEALVELRAGAGGEPRAYRRVERRRRDLAVGIVVDLSASTADPATDEDATRVLDREVEAVALLADALAEVGDRFGIYGFSGTGRHDVRVLRIKELAERHSPLVRERLSALRPLHMTRLAPVVRHVTRKLVAEPAATRLLVVICDGRPLDIDYGDHHVEVDAVDYALSDTRAAVIEALGARVRPVVIALDATGREYLSALLDEESGYEVVPDASALTDALVRICGRFGLLAARTRPTFVRTG